MDEVWVARVIETDRNTSHDTMVPVSQIFPSYGVRNVGCHTDMEYTEENITHRPTLGNLSIIRQKIHNLASQREASKRVRNHNIYHVNAVTDKAKEHMSEEYLALRHRFDMLDVDEATRKEKQG